MLGVRRESDSAGLASDTGVSGYGERDVPGLRDGGGGEVWGAGDRGAVWAEADSGGGASGVSCGRERYSCAQLYGKCPRSPNWRDVFQQARSEKSVDAATRKCSIGIYESFPRAGGDPSLFPSAGDVLNSEIRWFAVKSEYETIRHIAQQTSRNFAGGERLSRRKPARFWLGIARRR